MTKGQPGFLEDGAFEIVPEGFLETFSVKKGSSGQGGGSKDGEWGFLGPVRQIMLGRQAGSELCQVLGAQAWRLQFRQAVGRRQGFGVRGESAELYGN